MTTDTIELICEKLGTTIEELVPDVIAYNVQSAKVWIVIGIFLFSIGIILTFVAIMTCVKKSNPLNESDFWMWIFSIIFLVAGISITCAKAWSLRAFTIAPRLSAYKEIASWFKY